MREFKLIIVFIALVGVGLFAMWIWQAQRENERNQPAVDLALGLPVEEPVTNVPPKEYPSINDEERTRLNERLGLPDGYPVEIVPLFGGMEVLETDSGEAESTDGAAMHRWLVRGQSVANQTEVCDFYKDLMRKLAFAQTMYVSKPGEHGVDYGINYADENYEIRFEIERRREDTQTQIKTEVFKLVGEK